MSAVVAKTLISRRKVFQVVIIASLIALGVNLLSAWITSGYFGSFVWLQWVAGSLLILLGFLFFVRFLLQEKEIQKEIDGVVLLDHSAKTLVEIDDYDLSVRLHDAFRSAFLENAALRASWESEPIFGKEDETPPKLSDEVEKKAINNDAKQNVSYVAILRAKMDSREKPISEKSILLEAIEFCMLEFLSDHLSEYFGSFEGEDSHVCTLTRNDIPHILLENRILALLTAPIEDRQIFIDSGIYKNPPKGEVHYIFGSDGSMYERFDLRIPKGTRFLRPRPGCIRLQHKQFTLDMDSAFLGFCENLPPYFQDLYVGKYDEKLDAREVQFKLRAQLHSSALLCLKGWEYYRWIDSFVDYFENQVSFDAFLERIKWATVATQIRATLIREHLMQEKDEQNTSGKSQKKAPKIHI